MKKYTIEDFAKFERVEGRIICPEGDYTKRQPGAGLGRRCYMREGKDEGIQRI